MHPQITLSTTSTPPDHLKQKALIDWHLNSLSDINVKVPVQKNGMWQAQERPLSEFIPQLRSKFADYARFMVERTPLQHSSLGTLDAVFCLVGPMLLKPALPMILTQAPLDGETQDALREHIFKVLQMDDLSFNNAVSSFAGLVDIATKPLALGTVYVPLTSSASAYELGVKQSLHPYREMQARFHMMLEHMQQHSHDFFGSDQQASPEEKVALIAEFVQERLTDAHQLMVEKGMTNHKDFVYPPAIHCQVLLKAVDMCMLHDISVTNLRILLQSPAIVESFYEGACAEATRNQTPLAFVRSTEHHSVIAPVHRNDLGGAIGRNH